MFRFLNMLLVAVMACLFFQCQSSISSATTQEEKAFFDLRAFFEQEIVRLKAENPKIKKEIEINGKREEQTQEGVDFEKELAIFMRADINKPAWREKYKVDSTMVVDRLARLAYAAIDSSLKTRLLFIEFDQKEAVEKVFISNKTNSPLIQSEQQLTFEPAKGYRIENKQDLSLSKDSQLTIVATFSR